MNQHVFVVLLYALLRSDFFIFKILAQTKMKGKNMKKITTKQITLTAAYLAICVLSQFAFRNLPAGTYITGPLVNTCIILATLSLGMVGGLILSIISPITAFLISTPAVMTMMPLIIPSIMIGNATIALATWFFSKKLNFKFHLEIGLVVGSLLKACVMGILIVLVIFPVFHAPDKVVAAASWTFSFGQAVTALMGSVLSVIIWIPLKKIIQNEQ